MNLFESLFPNFSGERRDRREIGQNFRWLC